jgi:hypothetical protein
VEGDADRYQSTEVLMKASRRYGRIPLAVVSVAIINLACRSTTTPDEPTGGDATVTISLQIAVASAVAAAAVEVTGPGISTAITAELSVSGGTASGTVTVPTGANRTFTLRTFDEGGVEIHRGSVTVNITEGQNPNLSITLQPLTGELPIIATVGTITVTISPAADTVAIGEMAQYTASVTDVNGEVVADPSLSWSSSNPLIAEVDIFGQATGLKVGIAAIVATHQGVAAAASIMVQ